MRAFIPLLLLYVAVGQPEHPGAMCDANSECGCCCGAEGWEDRIERWEKAMDEWEEALRRWKEKKGISSKSHFDYISSLI